MSDTVLFVDDEEHVLNSIDRLFADSGFRIAIALNTREAFDVFNRQEVAVIVSDNDMPDMSGVEFLSRVENISPHSLKILMSGQSDLVTAVDAVNNGVVFRFVLKPWDGKAFKQTVQEAIERFQIIQCLRKEDDSTVLSLAQKIELKDLFTPGHCENVARYALMISAALNFSEEKVKELRYGSWLHDCGKIGVPEKILNKNSTLTENEFEIIKNHPRWGADIAEKADLSPPIVNVIHRHHERFDGSGYPSGLKGTDIPLEARIVTIADVFDALTADRPYRTKFDYGKAIKIMHAMNESVFDPELLNIFLYDCLKIDI
jgi:putative nucleotidyltransferase with HDIG domain